MTTKKSIVLLLVVLLIASLACNLPVMLKGGVGDGSVGKLPDGLTENYTPSLEDATMNPFNYSPDQIDVINAYGNPTRFMIIFTEAHRQETWIYDTSGYKVVFQDGVKLSEQTEPPKVRAEMYATTLGPNMFYRGMGIDEVVLSTGRANFHLVTLEGLEKESRLMYLLGLTVGLVNGKVNFVETIPATTETRLGPEDFAAIVQPIEEPAPATSPETSPPALPEISLTPQEEAAIGSYNYSIILYQDLAVSDCGSLAAEVYQQGDTLILVEAGEKKVLRRIGENLYSSSMEGVDITLKFTETGYVYWAEENGGLVEVYAFRELTDDIQIIQTPGLSADEQLNQGVHTYQVDFCQVGDIFDTNQITMEITFPEEGAELVESNELTTFLKLGTNFYFNDDDDMMSMIFTDIGFVWRLEDEPDDIFVIFSLLE